jgi:GT2 family glycosyltransferase
VLCAADSVIDKIYIIDNTSNDNAQEFVQSLSEKVIYIQGHGNIGYGAAHNIAIRKSIAQDAKYHVVLNPDIQFASNIILELLAYMGSNEDVGSILPKVLYPDGSIQYLSKLLPSPFGLFLRRFCSNTKLSQKINNKYMLLDSGYDKIINPPCLSGCFMFLNIKHIKEHDILFDEQFFMYFEDFDFFRRLHRIAKTIYYPYVSIIHNHAKESYKSRKMLAVHVKSAIKYFNKWGWFFDEERKKMNKKVLKEIELMNNPQR